MSNMVQQTPDGLVIVRVGSQVYTDTASNAGLDFGSGLPDLPTGAHDRVYEQGVRHACTDGITIVAGGDMPWAIGDTYIAGITAALAAQAARQPTPPPNPGRSLDALQHTQASPDNGRSTPQSSVRQEDGYTTVRGERVQPRRSKDGDLAKEEEGGIKRRI